jgi:hypothetical protein
MLACEIAVGVLIHFNFLNPGSKAMAAAIVALICIYVAGFAWSWCARLGAPGSRALGHWGSAYAAAGRGAPASCGRQQGLASVLLTLPSPPVVASVSSPAYRGPLGWLVPSEIQPLETRAAGTGINTFVNFMFTFLIGQIFLVSQIWSTACRPALRDARPGRALPHS